MSHGSKDSNPEDSASSRRDRRSGASSSLVEAARTFAGRSAPIHFGRSSGGTLGFERENQITRAGDLSQFPPSALGVDIVKGGEHEVYWSQEASLIHKVTFPDAFGYVIDEADGLSDRTFLNETKLQLRPALPSEYLIRWAILDAVFGMQTQFEGVLLRANGEISLVISQRFVGETPGAMPTWEQMEEFMAGFEFTRVPPSSIRTKEIQDVTWYRQRDGVLITDVFPRNFRIDVSGAVMPIDLVVNIVPPGASKLLPSATAPFTLRVAE
jgi:hypothetical protein